MPQWTHIKMVLIWLSKKARWVIESYWNLFFTFLKKIPALFRAISSTSLYHCIYPFPKPLSYSLNLSFLSFACSMSHFSSPNNPPPPPPPPPSRTLQDFDLLSLLPPSYWYILAIYLYIPNYDLNLSFIFSCSLYTSPSLFPHSHAPSSLSPSVSSPFPPFHSFLPPSPLTCMHPHLSPFPASLSGLKPYE